MCCQSVALFDLQNLQRTDTGGGGSDTSGRPQLSIEDLQHLLSSGSVESPEGDDDDEDDDDDDDYDFEQTTEEWRQQWFPPCKEPQKSGVELLMGGEFGFVSPKIRSRQNKKNISRLMLDQSLRPRGAMYRENMSSVCYSLVSHGTG